MYFFPRVQTRCLSKIELLYLLDISLDLSKGCTKCQGSKVYFVVSSKFYESVSAPAKIYLRMENFKMKSSLSMEILVLRVPIVAFPVIQHTDADRINSTIESNPGNNITHY